MLELKNIKKINCEIDKLQNDLTKEKKVSVSMLRLDKIDREISGNKLFKLYYFLQEAITSNKKIITFGGAYSNHLAATAGACKAYGINCIGIVRGEEPKVFSHTLIFCKQKGMHLEFISRKNYKRKDEEGFKKDLTKKYGEHILVPEGGFSKEGADGASLISKLYTKKNYTHVCCSVGTATTIAGLIISSDKVQQIIGFSALKNITDFEKRIKYLLKDYTCKNYCLINGYDFGGYAKKNDKLISFINKFYEEFATPIDFVYTAKMMFGVFDMIQKNYFKKQSKILCIHSGGLQGNLSLPTGTLNF